MVRIRQLMFIANDLFFLLIIIFSSLELSRWQTTRRGRGGIQVRVCDVLTVHSELFVQKMTIAISWWSLHESASLFDIFVVK